jgi:hypothetical protein
MMLAPISLIFFCDLSDTKLEKTTNLPEKPVFLREAKKGMTFANSSR